MLFSLCFTKKDFSSINHRYFMVVKEGISTIRWRSCYIAWANDLVRTWFVTSKNTIFVRGFGSTFKNILNLLFEKLHNLSVVHLVFVAKLFSLNRNFIATYFATGSTPHRLRKWLTSYSFLSTTN